VIQIKQHNLAFNIEADLNSSYTKFIESNHSFVAALQNQVLWQVTGEYARHLKDTFDELVIVGIGGSHLGAESFIKALTFPRTVSFFENPDPVGLTRRFSTIKDLSKTHFIFISKSGGTYETLAIGNWVIDQLKQAGLDVAKHCSVLTAEKDSVLKRWSDREGAWCLMVPPEVSGRYSVLTPVGMLPLMFALDKPLDQFFTDFYLGADSVLSSDERGQQLLHIYKNLIFNHTQTLNFWIYSDQMYGLGKWLRQLWSESLGQTNLPKGLNLPVFVLCKGASDQHSYLQQAIAQSAKSVNFVLTLKNLSDDFSNQGLGQDHFQSKWSFEDESFLEIFNSESMGLIKTFKELEIPYVHLELEDISFKSLVDFVLLHQVVVASLGQYLGINPFEQPQVEEMKKRLSELQKSKNKASLI
jgi:glucose-6-phosphate isomerase